MKYILFDLETTCWDTDYPPRQREIIEIAAIVIDEFGNEEGRFETFVRPEIHPHLSPYCIRLTQIEPEDVVGAPTFSKVHSQFSNWVDQFHDLQAFVAWGEQDEKILDEACSYHGLEQIIDAPYLDAKQAYHRINQLDYRIGLVKAVKREGLRFEGEPHRAMTDTYNLMCLFRKYLGEWPV